MLCVALLATLLAVLSVLAALLLVLVRASDRLRFRRLDRSSVLMPPAAAWAWVSASVAPTNRLLYHELDITASVDMLKLTVTPTFCKTEATSISIRAIASWRALAGPVSGPTPAPANALPLLIPTPTLPFACAFAFAW